jgi:hypothetical protein
VQPLPQPNNKPPFGSGSVLLGSAQGTELVQNAGTEDLAQMMDAMLESTQVPGTSDVALLERSAPVTPTPPTNEHAGLTAVLLPGPTKLEPAAAHIDEPEKSSFKGESTPVQGLAGEKLVLTDVLIPMMQSELSERVEEIGNVAGIWPPPFLSPPPAWTPSDREETPISLGSPGSLQQNISQTYSPPRAANFTPPRTNPSTYLRVYLDSSDAWAAFFADFRSFAFQENIEILEVFKVSLEAVHTAWISTSTNDDALRTHEHYTGTSFHGSHVSVNYVEKIEYCAAIEMATECWRSLPRSPEPKVPSKRRRSSMSHLSPDLYYSPSSKIRHRSRDRSIEPETSNCRRTSPPPIKRLRSNHHTLSRSSSSLHRDIQHRSRDYHRSPSPYNSHYSSSHFRGRGFRSRDYPSSPSPRHLRHSPSPYHGRRFRSREYYHKLPPQPSHCPPSPHHGHGSRSRNYHRSPSPRCSYRSPSLYHGHGFRSMNYHQSPSARHSHRSPSPYHGQAVRSSDYRRSFSPRRPPHSPFSVREPGSRARDYLHNPTPRHSYCSTSPREFDGRHVILRGLGRSASPKDDLHSPPQHSHVHNGELSTIRYYHEASQSPSFPFSSALPIPQALRATVDPSLQQGPAALVTLGSYLMQLGMSGPSHSLPTPVPQQPLASRLQSLPTAEPSGRSFTSSQEATDQHMFERLAVPLTARIHEGFKPSKNRGRRKRGKRKPQTIDPEADDSLS